MLRMVTGALTLAVSAQAKMRYASVLRCLGQVLQELDLKALEVKTHGDEFVVQAWNRGTSMAMDVEKHYTIDEIRNMNMAARQQRKPFVGPPDLLSLAQILRLAGSYVDRARGRLLRVSWQDQSDKIQSITVQWEPSQPGRDAKIVPAGTVEELCIHIYKRRKKINMVSERETNRPFVSVNRAL
jgi:hypothetical protein